MLLTFFQYSLYRYITDILNTRIYTVILVISVRIAYMYINSIKAVFTVIYLIIVMLITSVTLFQGLKTSVFY